MDRGVTTWQGESVSNQVCRGTWGNYQTDGPGRHRVTMRKRFLSSMWWHVGELPDRWTRSSPQDEDQAFPIKYVVACGGRDFAGTPKLTSQTSEIDQKSSKNDPWGPKGFPEGQTAILTGLKGFPKHPQGTQKRLPGASRESPGRPGASSKNVRSVPGEPRTVYFSERAS